MVEQRLRLRSALVNHLVEDHDANDAEKHVTRRWIVHSVGARPKFAPSADRDRAPFPERTERIDTVAIRCSGWALLSSRGALCYWVRSSQSWHSPRVSSCRRQLRAP